MVSPLAWPRTLLAIIYAAVFPNVVHAKIDSLCEWCLSQVINVIPDDYYSVTSSVTYCTPPEAILIQEFTIAYFAANQSVTFNISAASVVCDLHFPVNINMLRWDTAT